jgi:hypothetical protein
MCVRGLVLKWRANGQKNVDYTKWNFFRLYYGHPPIWNGFCPPWERDTPKLCQVCKSTHSLDVPSTFAVCPKFTSVRQGIFDLLTPLPVETWFNRAPEGDRRLLTRGLIKRSLWNFWKQSGIDKPTIKKQSKTFGVKLMKYYRNIRQVMSEKDTPLAQKEDIQIRQRLTYDWQPCIRNIVKMESKKRPQGLSKQNPPEKIRRIEQRKPD